MLKAVLFDWDGTLHYSMPNIEIAYEITCKRLGITMPYDEFRHYIGVPTVNQAEMLCPDNPEDFISVYREEYIKLPEPELYDGAKEALYKLKENFDVALVTSKTRGAAIRSLTNMGILDCFDHLICGDDVENPKPHPEPILKALEHFKISDDEAIYVGDSSHDINSAKGANVKVIGVVWGAKTKDEIIGETPNYVADTWDDVVNVCQSLK